MYYWIFNQGFVDGEVWSVWDFGDDFYLSLDSIQFHTFEIFMAQETTPLVKPINHFLLLPNQPQIFDPILMIPVTIH